MSDDVLSLQETELYEAILSREVEKARRLCLMGGKNIMNAKDRVRRTLCDNVASRLRARPVTCERPMTCECPVMCWCPVTSGRSVMYGRPVT